MSSCDRQTLLNAFKSLDKDGDGTVSSEELRNCLVACGFNEKDAKPLMEYLDSNKDGKITLDEFLNALQ
ncbi:unnamed protein product [Heterobilharzia americana]|nr:unnamed protein product [Heterobilharzia americana]CAH8669420.1 unnamed protein product [Heterobilharzia americana]